MNQFAGAGPDDLLVYKTPFVNPYTITDRDGKPMRLLFARMHKILQACQSDETPGQADITVILPGEMQHPGNATDGQYLPVLSLRTYDMGRAAGVRPYLKARVSWECDDRTLCSPVYGSLTPEQESDLEQYFGDYPGLKGAFEARHQNPRQWVEACRQEMLKNQAQLWLGEKSTDPRLRDLVGAKEVLQNHNLVIVGSPRVNRVMANLCDIILTQGREHLGELGMYLYPPVGSAPTMLRRFGVGASGESEWSEHEWKDRNVGWVHMMRNPWALNKKPRFLIYFGGFYAQGTLAAMRKRLQIGGKLMQLQPKDGVAAGDDPTLQNAIFQKMVHPDRPSDHRLHPNRSDESAYVPAHVVKARVRMPFSWFVQSSRLARVNGNASSLDRWSYEGSVREDDFDEI